MPHFLTPADEQDLVVEQPVRLHEGLQARRAAVDQDRAVAQKLPGLALALHDRTIDQQIDDRVTLTS